MGEDLPELHRKIVGHIDVIATFIAMFGAAGEAHADADAQYRGIEERRP